MRIHFLLTGLCLFTFVFAMAQADSDPNVITTGQQWNEINFTQVHKKIAYQGDIQFSTSNDSRHQFNIQ